jgi:hypothetical protein
VFERRTEELALIKRYDARNDYNHSGVQRLSPMKGNKVGAIVRYKRIVLLAYGGHELPIFGTTETEIVDVIGHVTRRMRQFDQRVV